MEKYPYEKPPPKKLYFYHGLESGGGDVSRGGIA